MLQRWHCCGFANELGFPVSSLVRHSTSNAKPYTLNPKPLNQLASRSFVKSAEASNVRLSGEPTNIVSI